MTVETSAGIIMMNTAHIICRATLHMMSFDLYNVPPFLMKTEAQRWCVLCARSHGKLGFATHGKHGITPGACLLPCLLCDCNQGLDILSRASVSPLCCGHRNLWGGM